MLYITIENGMASGGALVVAEARATVRGGACEIFRRESMQSMAATVESALSFAKNPRTLAFVGRVIVEQHGSILYDSASTGG